MMNWYAYLNGLYIMLAFGFLGWIISLYRNNVTHVDSMWSLFFVLSGFTYASQTVELTARTVIVMTLLIIWAVRLFVYLTWRNWNPHEDHRYAEIRRNNSPGFAVKSIYIIFGLQAMLAWVISLPILGAISSDKPINTLDMLGVTVFTFGFIWETIADWQLIAFKRNPANKSKVLNTGVWRYSRHPNYFGECCVWWGFYLIALAAGAWWAIPSAVLMTFLLLKVSGVSLLEKDIAERRPEYVDYSKSTNAFIPGKLKVVKK
jgi:steroid 5-alpha reductase family enzyme